LNDEEPRFRALATSPLPPLQRQVDQITYRLSRTQLDALWNQVNHKGKKEGTRKKRGAAPFGVASPPDIDTRLVEHTGYAERTNFDNRLSLLHSSECVAVLPTRLRPFGAEVCYHG
jgi:hypothetical protein